MSAQAVTQIPIPFQAPNSMFDPNTGRTLEPISSLFGGSQFAPLWLLLWLTNCFTVIVFSYSQIP